VIEPLAVLVGPTAVGKTAISLPVAEALQAEVLNVDSRQLYRYMDIGTAKPTWAQRTRIPHHLLDLLAPDERSTAAQFMVAARQVVGEVQARGKRVLVVAGSGLYLQALLYGLMPAPSAHEPLRAALRTRADLEGSRELHRWLQRLDPDLATQYHPNDRIRLVRALEVILLTGEPFSIQRRRHEAHDACYPYVAVGLTRERADLHDRIARRMDAMLAAGWLEEAEMLVTQGYTRACTAMNSLGYRELLAYLEGQSTWPDTVQAISRATRLFAKRQLTWFRKMPHLSWLNLSHLDEQTAVSHILEHFQEVSKSMKAKAPPHHSHDSSDCKGRR
jgi:tRNA dimethylallyltransferase